MAFTSRKILEVRMPTRPGTRHPHKGKFPQAFLPRLGTSNADVAVQKICHNDPTGFPRICPGAGAENLCKAGSAMKRILGQLFAVILSTGVSYASPPVAHAGGMIRISDPSICIDGMETVPGSDDQEPITAVADTGCTAPQGTISI